MWQIATSYVRSVLKGKHQSLYNNIALSTLTITCLLTIVYD